MKQGKPEAPPVSAPSPDRFDELVQPIADPMTPDQETHLTGIIMAFSADMDLKYRKGQKEHGGDLWKKPGMLKFLREETLDFVTYAHTLAQQLRWLQQYLHTAVNAGHKWAVPALGMVNAMLDQGPEDETGGTNAEAGTASAPAGQ